MAQPRNLERSTVETWGAVILAVFMTVIPMSWVWECALLVLAWLLLTDVILHSKMTARLWLPARIILTLYGFVILGLVGLPSASERYDTATHLKTPPQALAKALSLASAIERPIPMIGLLAGIAFVILWGTIPVWRFRHWLIFRWRLALTEEVWISRAAALDLIINSRWANSRPGAASNIGLGGFSALAQAINPAQAHQFRRFCELALDEFASSNSSAVRMTDEKPEYVERRVRDYLIQAYDLDVTAKFGKPPSIVT